jgi:hypothetical protein
LGGDWGFCVGDFSFRFRAVRSGRADQVWLNSGRRPSDRDAWRYPGHQELTWEVGRWGSANRG